MYLLNLVTTAMYTNVYCTLGKSIFSSSGFDLSTLEVRLVQRSHSGLSGTCRRSSAKWKLGKLWAATPQPRVPSGSWSRVQSTTERHSGYCFIIFWEYRRSPYIVYGQDLYATFQRVLQKNKRTSAKKTRLQLTKLDELHWLKRGPFWRASKT